MNCWIQGSYSTVFGSPFDFEITLVPPLMAPWVLNKPKVFSILWSVSHNCDCMIILLIAFRVCYRVTAHWVIENTISIVSKTWQRSLEKENNKLVLTTFQVQTIIVVVTGLLKTSCFNLSSVSLNLLVLPVTWAPSYFPKLVQGQLSNLSLYGWVNSYLVLPVIGLLISMSR